MHDDGYGIVVSCSIITLTVRSSKDSFTLGSVTNDFLSCLRWLRRLPLAMKGIII